MQDVYDGLEGVERGEAKWLRVIEETSRISPSPGSPNPFNQTFLVSSALAFATKIYHGITPIDEDGSVHFEVPSGRALYFQVLDEDRRLIQSMRTFVQAAPGTTRCTPVAFFKAGRSAARTPQKAWARPISTK